MDNHHLSDALSESILPPVIKAQKGVHEKVLEIFDRLPRGSVLDTPAGEGALSQRLRELGFHVTAGDIALDFRAAKVNFLRLDLDQALPFSEASFDYVACVEGIEHVENPYHLLREFARVLRPGATLVLSTPNVLCIRSRIRFFLSSYHRFFKDIYPGWHLTPLSYRELKYGLDQAGMRIQTVATNWYRIKWRPIYPLLRALIRWYTRLKHPLGEEVTTREILDGAILIIEAQKGKES